MTGTKSKSLRRLIILISILLLVSAASLTAIKYFNGDKIKQMIVAELNKHLTAPVSVKEIDISFIRSFPNASVILGHTSMKAPAGMAGAPGLIHADKITLKFNLINLLTGKYTIHSIDIQNAHISIFETGFGQNNYHIWKTVSTSKEANVAFELKKVTLRNSRIFYRNVRRNDDIALTATVLELKGLFQQKQYTLHAKGDCVNERMIISGTDILPAGPLLLDSEMEINNIQHQIDFINSSVNYNDISLTFNGKYNYSTTPKVDIYISSVSSSVSKIRNILPANLKQHFDKYNPEGDFTGHGRIYGTSYDISQLSVSAGFELKNSTIRYNPDKEVLVKDVNASGTFVYSGRKSSEILNIKDFSGKVRDGKFKGSMVMSNFNTPRIKLDVNVNTPFADLQPFIENKLYDKFKGTLIADIKYNGTYGSDKRPDRQTTGQVVFSDAGFIYDKNEITGLNGSLEFRENRLYFNGLTCSLGESDLKANGYIENLVSYLLDEEQNIHASLNLYSDKLVLENILGLAVEGSSTSKQTSIFPPHITFDALLNVRSLTYKKLSTQNITGTFSLKDDVLRGSDIQIQALDGRISANGLINGRYGNKAQIITRAEFRGVDINKLFYQFNDFGQKSLISSNLKGKADANVDFATLLYTDYTVNTGSIDAVADITIRNGELNDFEPLQALSRFLDASDLKNVKFETLSNRIEISHKTVLIPQMEIKSSALNLNGYGAHTFGNDIDYHVNMLLADVIKAKRKKPAEVDKYVEDDGYGKPRLFLKMTGPIDDPLVQYDVQAVKSKIADDFKKEKQVFREVLRKEFGGKKANEEPVTTTPKDNDKTEFQIEWDEIK